MTASDPGPDEASRSVVLAAMADHRVTEVGTSRRGYYWGCACGATSAGTTMTVREHQAQGVIEALRAAGWSEPQPAPFIIEIGGVIARDANGSVLR